MGWLGRLVGEEPGGQKAKKRRRRGLGHSGGQNGHIDKSCSFYRNKKIAALPVNKQ